MKLQLVGLMAATMLMACQDRTAEPLSNTDELASEKNLTAPADREGSQQFVNKIAASDMFEIESGKLAATKATRPDLKAFGEMLQTDHAMSTELLKAALGKGSLAPSLPPALPAELQSKLAALRDAQGSAFDQLFITQQAEAHRQALNELIAYSASGGQPALRDFANDAQPVVKRHLDEISAKGAR